MGPTLPYRVNDLLESLRETKWFFHAGKEMGVPGPAHRDPTWRHLRTGLLPAAPSDQAMCCFARTTPLLISWCSSSSLI